MIRCLLADPYIAIYEQPPTRRSIKVDTTSYYLQWPYLVFTIACKQGGPPIWPDDSVPAMRDAAFFVHGSHKPLQGANDQVFSLPVPNTYVTGRVCLGQGCGQPNDHYMRMCVDAFWSNTFKEGEVRSGSISWREATDWRYGKTLYPKTSPYKTFIETHAGVHLNLPHPFNKIITHQDIAITAEQLWQHAGKPYGMDDNFWFQAEQLLRNPTYTSW